MALNGATSIRVLETLETSQRHSFAEPSKEIHEGQDVSRFLTTKAYTDITTFLLQLNRSMFPSELPDGTVQTWPLSSDAVVFSESVRRLQLLLGKLETILQEAPPDKGPRRFGNISFKKWYQIVESRASDLLDECLSPEVLHPRNTEADSPSAKIELIPYFLGSFGSPQRLDYGTGHELSFLAFLACIWKLNGFPKADRGVEERGIVLGVIEPYLQLVRTIIKTYTLEPAGSHGVWGLDDHSFIPYIFGSAQLSPAIVDTDQTPVEGSLPGTPAPSGVAKATVVERERKTNMYFSAIGFIYDVKKGPFWEHSPMLYDISGIQAGWAKINKGMIKMYNAEVLSKFPVVQHFPFGSLLSWEKDPNAPHPPSTIHATSGPQARSVEAPPAPAAGSSTDHGARAPWATSSTGRIGATAAPWATSRGPASVPSTGTAPTLPDTSRMPPGPMAPTRAPWAQDQPPAGSHEPPANTPTRAPWAKP